MSFFILEPMGTQEWGPHTIFIQEDRLEARKGKLDRATGSSSRPDI
jgi:hypothetical protein